jgi:hypothetical protein
MGGPTAEAGCQGCLVFAFCVLKTAPGERCHDVRVECPYHYLSLSITQYGAAADDEAGEEAGAGFAGAVPIHFIKPPPPREGWAHIIYVYKRGKTLRRISDIAAIGIGDMRLRVNKFGNPECSLNIVVS